MRRLCLLICIAVCLLAVSVSGAEASENSVNTALDELHILGLIPDNVSPAKTVTLADLTRFAFRLKNTGQRIPGEAYAAIGRDSGYADINNLGGEYVGLGGYAIANRLFEPGSDTIYGIASYAAANDLAYVCLRLLGMGENYLSRQTTETILELASIHVYSANGVFADPSRTFTFETVADVLLALVNARTVDVAVMPNTLTIVRRTVTLRDTQYGNVSLTNRRIVSVVEGGYLTDTGLFVPADEPSDKALGLFADVAVSEKGVGLAVVNGVSEGKDKCHDGSTLSQNGFMLLVPDDELAFLRIDGKDYSVYLSAQELIWFCGPDSTVAYQIPCGDVMLAVSAYYNARPSYTIRCVTDRYDRPVYLRIYPK